MGGSSSKSKSSKTSAKKSHPAGLNTSKKKSSSKDNTPPKIKASQMGKQGSHRSASCTHKEPTHSTHRSLYKGHPANSFCGKSSGRT